MRLFDITNALMLVPSARKHLLKIVKQLDHKSYNQLILESFPPKINKKSINVIVKSYFWASRTIKNCHCLPRSIALYQRLRAEDYVVEHKFGVNKKNQSLSAHAWVEYKNTPLNESDDLKKRFSVLQNPK